MSKYKFNRNFAVVIGINDYTNGIRGLETAVPDALKLAQILQKQHQALKPQYQAQNRYEVQLILNQRATFNQLNQLISDFKKGQIPLDNEKVAVTEDDRVFFYFAGHGIALEALENQEGPVGYLIPQDAILEDSSTYLPMQELHDALSALPCRHMLAILDCCFAGAFRWASLKREIVPKVTVYKERYDRFISDRAWQVITSAADDQKALDSLGLRGKVIDGNEVHSPFAKALFDALRGGADEGADLNKDGIITATELYSYLRDQVEILTENYYKRQTPGLCPLRKHDKGEFIFLLPDFDRDKLEDAPPLNLENNPYRGLQSYDEKDRHLFFGRENLIEKLYQKAVDNKQALTLVLGASGTGKSSLMKAGLLHRLRDSQDHQFKILDPMRPGESPLKALAQVCLPIATTITASELAKDEQALANIIEHWSKNYPNTKLLLPVDQFEELITLCKSDQEREQFQTLIKNALAEYPDKIHVVITLRLDFEAQFQTSVLKDFWNDDTRFVVPPMTQDEFREAIEKPASEKVVYFDPPSLVDELINEVVQMPGALPLLSFTLSELYLKYLGDRTRDNRALTKKDYEELGRVVGSLTKRANDEYDRLVAEDPAYKDTVRRVMLRMISLQGRELARRQVPKSELVYANEEENKRVQTVIKRFSDARLIVEGSNSQGEPYVEPAHDSLVQGWNRLLEWKKEEEENLILQRRLTPAAEEWKSVSSNLRPLGWQTKSEIVINWLDRRFYTIENLFTKIPTQIARLWQRSQNKQERSKNRPVQFLWYGNPYLDIADQELNSNDNWLNQVETEFVQQSVLQKRQNISWRWRIAVTVMLGLSGLTIAALIQWRDSQLNQANSLGRYSQSLFSGHNELEAFVETIKAGKILQKQHATDLEVMSALQEALYEGSERNRLEGHNSLVSSVSFSPDGKILASASGDNTIKLWDLETGKEIRTLQGHGSPVRSVSFSPDDKTLASASVDRTIKLWDLETGKEIRTLQHSNQIMRGSIHSVSFSPDGKTLASASGDNTIKLWNLEAGKEIRTLQGHDDAVYSVSFSPDGKTLASGSVDRTIKLWNLEAGKEIRTLQGHRNSVNSVSFSPDGKTLASASGDNTIKLWNLEAGKEIRTLQGHRNSVNSVSFSPDGKTLASASGDNTIKLWNLEAGKEIRTLQGHRNWVNSVSFSPDGKTLASGSRDKTIKLWNLETSKKIRIFQGHDDFVQSVSFSPDGKTLASGGFKTIKLWDLETGKEIRILQGHNDSVHSASFSPDGKTLASGGFKTIKLWDLETGKEIRILQRHDWVNSVSFSPDGKTLATGNDHNSINLWNLETGKEIRTLQGHNAMVYSVSFSPDGKTLASGSYDQTINLWNLETGKKIRTLQGHESLILSVSFSPDGSTLASGSEDNTIKLWDLETGKEIRTLQGHRNSVNSVSFSPDGKTLASGSRDRTIKLWNLETGKEIRTLQGHDSWVNSVSFSPDGKTLASGSRDKTIKLWNLDLSLDSLIGRSCDWVRNYLQNNPNVKESDRRLCDGIGDVQPRSQNTPSPTGRSNNRQETASSSAPTNVQPLPQNTPSPTPPSNNGQNNYRQAPSDRKQASKLNSTSVNAYINQGLTYHRQRNYQQAIRSYSKAIALNPNSATAYSNRASAYIGQKDYHKAIADSSKAISLNPTYANAYINRGVAYYRQGNSQQAIADYTKALKLAPGNVNAYNYWALAYTRLGNQQAA